MNRRNFFKVAVGAALVPVAAYRLYPEYAASSNSWVTAEGLNRGWPIGVATLYKDEQRYINAIMRASLDRPEFEKALIHSIRRLT